MQVKRRGRGLENWVSSDAHRLIDLSQTDWERSRNIIRSQQVRDRRYKKRSQKALTPADTRYTLLLTHHSPRGARTTLHVRCWRSPTRARGAGDLGPAKAESPALFVCLCVGTVPLSSGVLPWSPAIVLPLLGPGTSCAHVVLLRQGMLAPHAPVATSWYVGQPHQWRLHTTLRPLGETATAAPTVQSPRSQQRLVGKE